MKKSTSRKKRNLLQNILYGIYLFVSWLVNKIKNVKFSKILVVVILVSIVLFTLKMIQIFETQGAIPDTLVGALLPSLLGELWIISKITRNKDTLKSNEQIIDHEYNDDDYLGG